MAPRGRPRAGETAARRQAVLDAALRELEEHGYAHTTMLGIAKRAGASKETLYKWFGDKQGVFAALIEAQGLGVAAGVEAAINSPGEPHEVLTRFGFGLLRLLTGTGSIALNRASMNDPELAAALLAGGRYTAGPIVEQYLTTLAEQRLLTNQDASQAFEVLYGLLIRDTQIRVLLGEDPASFDLELRAAEAASQFLALYGKAP